MTPRTSQAPSRAHTLLQQAQVRIVDTFTIGGAIGAVPALAGSLSRIPTTGFLPVYGLQLAVGVTVMLLAWFRHRVSIEAKLAFHMVAYSLLAVSSAANAGVAGQLHWVLVPLILLLLVRTLRDAIVFLCGVSALWWTVAIFHVVGVLKPYADLNSLDRSGVFWAATHIAFLVVAVLFLLSLARYRNLLDSSLIQIERQNRKLVNLNQELEQRLEFLPVAIGICTLDGRITFVNRAFVRTFGFRLEDIPTVDIWAQKTHPDPVERAASQQLWLDDLAAAQSRESREVAPRLYPVVCADGKIRQVAIGFRIVEEDVITSFSDQTELIAMQESIRQSERLQALGQLAGGVAHDFNNILAIIMGYADIAATAADQGKPTRDAIDQILTASKRAKTLVAQILTYARKKAATSTLVDPAVAMREALKLIAVSIPASVTMTTHIDAIAGCVRIDPTRIHEILMNLCTNAVHAMADKGELEVSLTCEHVPAVRQAVMGLLAPGNYACICVRDTGSGMSASVLEKIFDPFFTTKGPGKGTGMGLAVVHGIVRANGGNIEVLTTEGHGTTFYVLLPIVDEPPTEATPAAPPALRPPVAGATIVLVDDEPVVLDATSILLSQAGYAIRSFVSSQEALAYLRSAQPADLLLTDHAMPVMTGLELAAAGRSLRPKLPIILMTGQMSKIDSHRADDVGVALTVEKPMRGVDLVNAVASALRTS